MIIWNLSSQFARNTYHKHFAIRNHYCEYKSTSIDKLDGPSIHHCIYNLYQTGFHQLQQVQLQKYFLEYFFFRRHFFLSNLLIGNVNTVKIQRVYQDTRPPVPGPPRPPQITGNLKSYLKSIQSKTKSKSNNSSHYKKTQQIRNKLSVQISKNLSK